MSNPLKRGQLEDSEDGMIILKWNLGKEAVRM
jgi:hypothetical protein